MPPQKRTASRGRRDPTLLADDQGNDQAVEAFAVGGDDETGTSDELDANTVYLYEGESLTVRMSIPVTLSGMERYSLVDVDAHVTVQPDEHPDLTAARGRDAVRKQFFLSVAEMEDDLAAYAEQEAANAARLEAATRRRQQ